MSTPANPDLSNYDAARERFATSNRTDNVDRIGTDRIDDVDRIDRVGTDRTEVEPVEVTRTTRTTTTPDAQTPASGARPYGAVAADLGVDRESVTAPEE